MVIAQRLLGVLALVLAAAALGPARAAAAPPPNDAPEAAGAFTPYSTSLGPATDQQAVAELAEATADRGVPRCLGRQTFTRTVWYHVPATAVAREISIEASGRTTAPIDLAVFVQPGGDIATAALPNACAGEGTGAADLGEDATSALTVRVPAFQSILVQVGRHGPRQSPPDEEVVLILRTQDLGPNEPPRGDRGDLGTPTLGRRTGRSSVDLFGATLTQEDPAVVSCPSFASVWRRAEPSRTGRWTATLDADEAGSLAIFAGGRANPDPDGFVGCVDREGPGDLMLPLRARKGRPLWIRVGTDRPAFESTATVTLRRFRRGDSESGGACLGDPRSRLGGRLTGGTRNVKRRNRFRGLVISTTVARGPLCDARFRLIGPRKRVYARGEEDVVRGRGQRVKLRRTRKLRKGRYRLRVDAAGYARLRVAVPSSVKFRLR
jgi:hypothetical protein